MLRTVRQINAQGFIRVNDTKRHRLPHGHRQRGIQVQARFLGFKIHRNSHIVLPDGKIMVQQRPNHTQNRIPRTKSHRRPGGIVRGPSQMEYQPVYPNFPEQAAGGLARQRQELLKEPKASAFLFSFR